VRLIKLKLLGARGGLVMWETRIAMGWLFGCVRLVMSRWFLEGVGVLFFFCYFTLSVLDGGIQPSVAKTACSRATCSISRACRHKDVE
jgi:hypothetical protein